MVLVDKRSNHCDDFCILYVACFSCKSVLRNQRTFSWGILAHNVLTTKMVLISLQWEMPSYLHLLTYCFTNWRSDQLTDWPTDPLPTDRLTDLPSCVSVVADRLIKQLKANWLSDWLTDWLTDWLNTRIQRCRSFSERVGPRFIFLKASQVS